MRGDAHFSLSENWIAHVTPVWCRLSGVRFRNLCTKNIYTRPRFMAMNVLRQSANITRRKKIRAKTILRIFQLSLKTDLLHVASAWTETRILEALSGSKSTFPRKLSTTCRRVWLEFRPDKSFRSIKYSLISIRLSINLIFKERGRKVGTLWFCSSCLNL